MKDLTTLHRATLMEKLVKHTNEYLIMLKTGALFEDYESCKELIACISEEIRRRGPNDDGKKASIDH